MAKEYFVKEEDIDVLKSNVDKKISSPNTAEVGQILSVKAIDGNGKPTEWEVVDKPESSSLGNIKIARGSFSTGTIYGATDKKNKFIKFWLYKGSNSSIKY